MAGRNASLSSFPGYSGFVVDLRRLGGAAWDNPRHAGSRAVSTHSWDRIALLCRVRGAEAGRRRGPRATGARASGELAVPGMWRGFGAAPSSGGAPLRIRQERLHDQFAVLLGSLKLDDHYKKLFSRVVEDAWHQKRKTQEDPMAAAKKRHLELKDRKQRLVDALLYDRIDQTIYDDQMRQLGTAFEEAEEMLAEGLIDEAELLGLVEFAEAFLVCAPSMWRTATPGEQLLLLQAVFPGALVVGKEGFGTQQPILLFKQLAAGELNECGLASPAGFEPALSP